MFTRFSEFKRDGKELKYINERFEYFHHYWTLLFLTKTGKGSRLLLKPNYLFIEEDKLESHRSLFIKISKQLNYNYPKAKDKLEHLFEQHPYFSEKNVLVRKYPGLARKIALTKQELSAANGNDFKNSRPQVKNRICNAFKDLESQLFRRYPYEKRLASHLHKILSSNRPLNAQVKIDIKFLVNAFIVELYQYGYSETYIGRVPDIISLRDHLEDFPYDKTPRDFENDDAYRHYVEGENGKMNLKTILNGLLKLVSGRKYNGYVIFKIDGVAMDKNKTLQKVEFYNPQQERKAQDYYSSINMDPELFEEKKSSDEPSSLSEPSTCNAIVRASMLSPSKRNGSQILRKAYRQVETSSLLLSNLLSKYADTTFGRISVNPQRKKVLLFFESNGIPIFIPHEIFGKGDKPRNIEFLYEQNIVWLEKELKFYDFDLTSKIGRRVVNLVRQQKSLENDGSEFNFKDLWTAWEGIFEEGDKKEELKNVSKDAMRIYLSTNFLPKVKSMLHRSLSQLLSGLDQSSVYYQLKESDIRSLGLGVPKVGINTIEVFKKKYKDILSVIDFSLLREIIERVNIFAKKPDQYYREVDAWVEQVIDEVYAERNLEVHNNEETDLSYFKLQAAFLEISAITVNEIIRNLNARNKNDIQKVLAKIESKASKV